jgi:LAGLIDADG DNA endonuclease family protein
MSDEFNFCYLAGYIDGDGCFYIDTVKFPGKNRRHHRTVLKFASVDREIMEWLSDFFSISFWEKVVSKKRKHLNRRMVYEANLTGESLDKLLPRIWPYLRIKKRHCEIMMRMRETYKKPKKGCISAPISDEIYKIRCSLHAELRSINTHKPVNPSALSPSRGLPSQSE